MVGLNSFIVRCVIKIDNFIFCGLSCICKKKRKDSPFAIKDYRKVTNPWFISTLADKVDVEIG